MEIFFQFRYNMLWRILWFRSWCVVSSLMRYLSKGLLSAQVILSSDRLVSQRLMRLAQNWFCDLMTWHCGIDFLTHVKKCPFPAGKKGKKITRPRKTSSKNVASPIASNDKISASGEWADMLRNLFDSLAGEPDRYISRYPVWIFHFSFFIFHFSC
jgi:hypothetical protein